MPSKWIREKCVSCSLCTVLCPYNVFKQENGRIEWNVDNCVDCEICLPIKGCPRRAIDK